jgi:hypothetical protein
VKHSVRIQGLVKLADQVRREIGRGIPDGQRDALRSAVHRAITQVDNILHQQDARPSRLASPSRRAYQFLKDLRWDTVPQSASHVPPPPTRQTFRLPGLGPLMTRLTRRLAAGPDDRELAEIARAIDQASRRTEQAITRQRIAAEQLTPAAREHRAWFAFFATAENLRQYVTALALARAAIESARPSGPTPRTFAIDFGPSRHIYKMRTRGNLFHVELPTPMIRFDAAGFADLAQLILSHERDAKRRVVERMRAEAYVDAMTELDALGGVTDTTRGAFHDLADSVDRVNAAYFAGRMPRPRLTWSRSFTRRKFGHYDHVKDWVMVSSTLDQPHVPSFVVDFLMYHELLHKKHGIHWVNGRGLAHTRSFYADEERFAQFHEAENWLKKLARA